jgi:hypothetical protein
MSEMEQWKGKLTKIDIPEKYKTWKEQIKYLKTQGNYFESIDFNEEYCDYKDSSCFYYDSQWYEITTEQFEDYNDIFNATEGPNNEIHFVLKYYNGRCCFDEALEEALKRLAQSKGGKK